MGIPTKLKQVFHFLQCFEEAVECPVSNGYTMAQSFVDGKIQAGKVTVFMKPSCPYCTKATELLNNYPFKAGRLEIIDISGHELMSAIQDYLQQLTGERTVPRIFIGEKSVGGCSNLVSLENSGKLRPMILAIDVLQ